jgi:hypothetical protein
VLWTVIGLFVFLIKPEYRDWLLPLRLLFDFNYLLALLWQFVLFVTLCICSAHSVGQHSPILTIADQVDHLPRRSRIGIDLDDNMRSGTLDLVHMVSSTSVSSAPTFSIFLVVRTHSWRLSLVSAHTPVSDSLPTCNNSNIHCNIPNLLCCNISGCVTAKYCILPPH